MKSELFIDVQPEEIALALVEDDRLMEVNREKREMTFNVGNIYLGKVKKTIPSLNAAFVDIGHEKDAFIHYLDLGENFLKQNAITQAVLNSEKIDYTQLNQLAELDKDGKITKDLNASNKNGSVTLEFSTLNGEYGKDDNGYPVITGATMTCLNAVHTNVAGDDKATAVVTGSSVVKAATSAAKGTTAYTIDVTGADGTVLTVVKKIDDIPMTEDYTQGKPVGVQFKYTDKKDSTVKWSDTLALGSDIYAGADQTDGTVTFRVVYEALDANGYPVDEIIGEENISYGDRFYRSVDGGLSWTDITPGKLDEKDSHLYYVSRPLYENGYAWIVHNSIHWGPGLEIDPRDSDRIVVLSGNGLWVCDNVWKENDVQFYFDPNGIEKVVPIDLLSIRGGYVYSTVLDYDGFIHKNIKEVGIQFHPTMGGTSTIASCRQNPNVMLRISDRNDIGYYSEDSGFTWKEMDNIFGVGGGRGAITIIADEKYRFFHALSDRILYTDNYGKEWLKSAGTLGQDINIYIEEKDPMVIYTYSNTKNDDSNKKNILGISGDGGKTFITKVVSDYDETDFSNRIAYLSEGKIALAAGTKGLYIVSNYGDVITKLETVVYCKSVGFGVPEQGQRDNTIFIYGKPFVNDPLGVYFSKDEGKNWILINHKTLYGGTGNGNFVVGDMNTFGTVYMSSLGTGIIYGKVKY